MRKHGLVFTGSKGTIAGRSVMIWAMYDSFGQEFLRRTDFGDATIGFGRGGDLIWTELRFYREWFR